MSAARTVDEARSHILESVAPLGRERVMLDEAMGRVLAEDLVSPTDWPRFDNSAMDGYAVRHADLSARADAGQPLELEVIETVTAGATATRAAGPGQCFRIMTGAELPAGVDTVIMREETDESVPGRVVVRTIAPLGANIRRRGESFRAGQAVVPRGTRVDAGVIGLIASFARSRVAVWRRPRVALLTTGDELVELDEPVGPGQIVNSSSYMLAAQIRATGALPIVLPIVRDEYAAIESAFGRALAAADVVVSVGGVSVGDRDLVREAIQRRSRGGVDFWRVQMKPGKPLAFGLVDKTPLFGLPGNPVSSFVTFVQFVRPALLRMQGVPASGVALPRITARLDCRMRAPKGRPEFVRGYLSSEADGSVRFIPCGEQGSGNLLSIAAVDGLAILPAGAQLEAGDPVTVELLETAWYGARP